LHRLKKRLREARELKTTLNLGLIKTTRLSPYRHFDMISSCNLGVFSH